MLNNYGFGWIHGSIYQENEKRDQYIKRMRKETSNQEKVIYDDGGYPQSGVVLTKWRTLTGNERIVILSDSVYIGEEFKVVFLLPFAEELQAYGLNDSFIDEAITCIKRDNQISLMKLKTALNIMQKFDLNPKLIREVNKSIFIDLIDYYRGGMIKSYYVFGSPLEHWSMYVRVKTGNESILLRVHLLADSGERVEHLELTIKARNGGIFNPATLYIYPEIYINTVFRCGGIMQECNIPWNDFIIAVTMDNEAFKPYNSLFNNCQQWIERVCKRLQLAHKVPLIRDNTATSYRQSTAWNCLIL